MLIFVFFFSSRRRHTRWPRDWSSDVCSSDLRLRAGDSFVFDAGRQHLYVNETDAPAKGVFFVVGRSGGPAHTGAQVRTAVDVLEAMSADRKSTRLNSSHVAIAYADFCLKKKNG